MASLGGLTVASSYDRLLTLPSGGGNGAHLVALSDGDEGTTFALKLSTTDISVPETGKIYLDGGDSSYIYESSNGVIEVVADGESVLKLTKDGIGEINCNTFRIQDENNIGSSDSSMVMQSQLSVSGLAAVHSIQIGGNNYNSDVLLLGRASDHNAVNVVLAGNVGCGTHIAYPEGPRSGLHVQSREASYEDKTTYNQCHIDPSSSYGSGFCITSTGTGEGGWARGLNCNLNSDITGTGKLSQFAFHGNPEYIYKTLIGKDYTNYALAYHHHERRTSICGGATGSIDAYGNITPASGSYTEDAPDGILTIQQGTDDSNILTFKSTDVAHGLTSIAETDTYAEFAKGDGATGGLRITALADGSAIAPLRFDGYCTTMNTTQGTGYMGAIDFLVKLHDNNGNEADLTTNGNVFAVGGRVGGVTRRLFIIDASGDLHCDGGGGAIHVEDGTQTNVKIFDGYNDAQLVRALDMNMPNTQGLIENQWDKYIDYNEQTLIDAGILGDKLEEGGMTNITRLQRLHNGAIWQQYEQFQNLLMAFTKVSNEVIGKEATQELLDSNNIKKLGDA